MTGPYCPYVSGPVLVRVNLRDGNGFVNVGYTVDGVQPQDIFFTNDIHGDQYGGTAGPPIDRQFMGKQSKISMSLVNYNLAVVKKMREAQASTNWASGAAGTLVNIGGLLTCGNRAFQLLLVGEADTAATAASAEAPTIATFLNFPNCWYDGPIDYPIGSKNTVFNFDVKATPFTTDTTQSGNGLTYLFTENNHLITNMATYAGSAQTA
jgi:hypothetical protein